MTLFASPRAAADPVTPQPEKWRPVVYADLQVPGERALPYASLWADEIRRNNAAYRANGDTRWSIANAPAASSHFVVRSPNKIVVLSVLHTVTGCSTVRSDPVAKATLKRCPMRLAIYQDGHSDVSYAGLGCFIEYGGWAGDAPPDLVRNVALAAYDVATHTIRAGVVFQGEAADECQFRVHVPKI